MATREVLRMGDARLLRSAEEVSVFDTPELHALLADMRDTMHARWMAWVWPRRRSASTCAW